MGTPPLSPRPLTGGIRDGSPQSRTRDSAAAVGLSPLLVVLRDNGRTHLASLWVCLRSSWWTVTLLTTGATGATSMWPPPTSSSMAQTQRPTTHTPPETDDQDPARSDQTPQLPPSPHTPSCPMAMRLNCRRQSPMSAPSRSPSTPATTHSNCTPVVCTTNPDAAPTDWTTQS